MHPSRPDPSPGQHDGITEIPVITSCIRVDLGCPPKIAKDRNQCPVKHVTVDEIRDQGTGGGVELRQQRPLEPGEIAAVRIPCGIRIRCPGDGDKPRSRFQQTARQQHALAVDITAIGLPGGVLFLVDPEGGLDRGGDKDVQSLALKPAHGSEWSDPRGLQASVEFCQQVAAGDQATGVDILLEAELGNGKITCIRILQNPERVECLAHPSTPESRLRRPLGSLLGLVRQAGVRDNTRRCGAQVGQDGTWSRVVGG